MANQRKPPEPISAGGVLYLLTYSNTAEISKIFVIGTRTHQVRVVTVHRTGLTDMVEDGTGRYLWIADSGVFEGQSNSYIIRETIGTWAEDKIQIGAERPTKVLSKGDMLYILCEGNGFRGYIVELNERTRKVVARIQLNGYLTDFVVVPGGDLVVTSDQDTAGQTLYRLDGASLSILAKRPLQIQTQTQGIADIGDSLYLMCGANEGGSALGNDMYVISAKALAVERVVDIRGVPNQILLAKRLNAFVLLKYYPGPTPLLQPPYAIEMSVSTGAETALPGVPESESAAIEGGHLWTVTKTGRLSESSLKSLNELWSDDFRLSTGSGPTEYHVAQKLLYTSGSR